MERIRDLAHVEMFGDKVDESLDFFTRIFGLTLSGRDETSAYLWAWDDYEFRSLKLTRHTTTGVGHIAERAALKTIASTFAGAVPDRSSQHSVI